VSEIGDRLGQVAESFGGKVRVTEDLRGGLSFEADRDRFHDFVRQIKEDPELRFEFLVVLTAHDNYLVEPRFHTVYVLRSLENNVDLRLNVPVDGEEPEVATLSDLFEAANWMEREVYDMFGIRFTGHPNLERILMWEGFEGWPLRKDYPLLGNTPGTPGYIGKGGKL
jgi:NADH-quinone oxidoreductase subunit C